MKYIAFVVVILSISCSKSKEVKYPKRLYLRELSGKQNVRLFTNNAEIKSLPVINDFIGGSQNFEAIEPIRIDANSHYIEFSSADTAAFSYANAFKYQVVKSGNQFILKSQPVRPHLDDIIGSIKKYPDEVLGSSIFYTISETVIGYGDYSRFELCLLAYKIAKHSQQNGNYIALGVLKNEFNQNYISTLGPNDTIAIQEYRYLFK